MSERPTEIGELELGCSFSDETLKPPVHILHAPLIVKFIISHIIFVNNVSLYRAIYALLKSNQISVVGVNINLVLPSL
jgi:hypothetical protein